MPDSDKINSKYLITHSVCITCVCVYIHSMDAPCFITRYNNMMHEDDEFILQH